MKTNRIKRSKPSELPASLLKEYPEHAKLALSYLALNAKDYDSLDALFDAMENPYVILNKVFLTLDNTALERIISKAKITPEGIIKLIEYCNLEKIIDQDATDLIPEITSTEENIKASKMIKLVLDYQSKDNISTKTLMILSSFLTKEEFEEFIDSKQISLNEFPNLSLIYYKFDKLEPILLKKHSLIDYVLNKVPSPKNTLDLLLSRSYTDELNVEEISNIYIKLYNLSPISKEILVYTAALISKNNSIKIIFTKNIDPSYNAANNIIQIDTNFIKNDIFNIESVLIHEMGHYIYEQLFETGSLPFSFEEAKHFMKQYREEINDHYLQESWGYNIFTNNSKLEEFKKILEEPLKYEKVARKPLYMAAKLLNMDLKELDKYIDSNDIAEYFKDHSYIDLFQLNNAISLGLNPDIHEISIDVLDNIFNIYLSQQNTYGISIDTQSNSYLPQDNADPIITKESILKWALEEFLPQLVSQLDLSPTKIHFLERIADYVNRGSHFLDKNGRSDSDVERHIELTVRATELRASGVEPEIIESFAGLESLHIQTASPKICDTIHSSEVASIPFNGEVGSLYICLEG